MSKVSVVLARHGKKGAFNSNRIANPEEVRGMASKFDLSGYDMIGVRSTPIERAVHTAVCVCEGLAEAGFHATVEVCELTSGVLSTAGTDADAILQNSTASKDLNLISQEIREVYKNAVESCDGSSWSKEDAGVNAWVLLLAEEVKALGCLGSEEFKAEQLRRNGISMLECVLRMAKHMLGYIELASSGKSSWFYEVNHAGFIEPWLVYFLATQIDAMPVATGHNTFFQMGGAFEPSEAVTLSFSSEGIAVELRGKRYAIAVSVLQQAVRLLDEIAISEQILALRK
ncbi:MAG: hypothetical protein Q8L11_01655 [Candidatus Moranbacteria bacterium]|nr:hypothetical protein [bacterium]MDP1833622.1 hypothetical protein [Candidatus Moranbacteria bacterium]